MAAAPSLRSPAAPPTVSPRQALRVVINEEVQIPAEVVDLDSFCRWACSDEFPQRGRFSFVHGALWVDLTMEQLYTHNQVKAAFTVGIVVLLQGHPLGRYFPDGIFLSNAASDLATVPDGVFVTFETLRSGRGQRVEGTDTGYVRLEGTPDVVLEVVSDNSVHKDTVLLRQAYWIAGIPEYWLVDARGAAIQFDILKHGAKGYTTTRRQPGGWVKSKVFGRSFQLMQQADPLGDPQYTLTVRE
jgi:Uma2 family endonuclease